MTIRPQTEAWQHAFKSGNRICWATSPGDKGVVVGVRDGRVVVAWDDDPEVAKAHDTNDVVRDDSEREAA